MSGRVKHERVAVLDGLLMGVLLLAALVLPLVFMSDGASATQQVAENLTAKRSALDGVHAAVLVVVFLSFFAVIWGYYIVVELITDGRSPGDLAGLVIGGVVIAIIMVVGPITGASLNPARAFGPELVSAFGNGATHWNQLIPVYVVPGLVGAAVAAVSYDWIAKPRLITMPVAEAVTHPDPGPRESAAATR